jgi:hypothetical protein
MSRGRCDDETSRKLQNNDAMKYQASTLTYFSTCPFGQQNKKINCPTQSFSCPKKLIKISKTIKDRC